MAVIGITEDKSAKVCKASTAMFPSIQKNHKLATFLMKKPESSEQYTILFSQ